jgi:integrase
MIPNNYLIIPKDFSPLTKECTEVLFQTGKNRSTLENLQIQAMNDIDAIGYWLNEYKSTQSTYKAYQKEAQRLLLWCAIEAKKPLSALTRDEFELYCNFLLDPKPHSLWCGAKTSKKELWRPFVKGLSSSAIITTISIINSMMQYLVQAGYLSINPLELIRKKSSFNQNATRKIKSLERKLELDEIHALLQEIEKLPEDCDRNIFYKNRLRFLVTLLMLTGLRIHEVIKHSWNSFRLVQGRWWLFIIGKGNKPRHIPVNDELLKAIKFYRQSLNKLPYPLSDDNSPILSSYIQINALSQRHIHHILKKLGSATAERFANIPDKFQRLENLSAHTFRHIYALLQDMSDISLTHIRDNLGHSNITTTSIYLHSTDVARHKELQRISLYIGEK